MRLVGLWASVLGAACLLSSEVYVCLFVCLVLRSMAIDIEYLGLSSKKNENKVFTVV